MHIVITGASSGIGWALAKAFDRPGNTLSLVARRTDLLEDLRRQLQADAHIIEADLARADHRAEWLIRAEQLGGPTDLLINNAGTSYVEPTAGIEYARIRALFQLNLHTPVAAIHHVLPAMLARGAGTIVNIASNAAFSPAPFFAHYTASKGALGNFSESLRMEIRHTGVHVLTVYPGPIRTPMGDRNWAQLAADAASKLAPVGDAAVLAGLVRKAVERRRARVIYPRFYTLGWWLPGIGRWAAQHLLPAANGGRTPPLAGDVYRNRGQAATGD